jgi:hypothetical protein
MILKTPTRRTFRVPALATLGVLVGVQSLALPATAAQAAPAPTRELAPGVVLSVSGPVRAVTIDPSISKGRLVVARKPGRLTPTSALTRSVGGVVGVNGSFFAGRGPKGLAAAGGRIVGSPTGYAPERTLLVDAKSLRIGAFDSGAELREALGSGTSAITGRFHLLSDGEVVVGTGRGNLYRPHVRTIAGTTGDGRIVMATIGRRVTPRQAAGIAASLGMTDAINLDGGGSSTMAIRGRAVNRSGERAVADALVWKVAGGAKAGSAGNVRRAGAKAAGTKTKVKRVATAESQWWATFN